jgi:threonine/homoserine/homoserine lactone efflux protein
MVMAPGPDFMNVVGQSLRGSFRNGLMSAVGVGAGYVTAAILELSTILLREI